MRLLSEHESSQGPQTIEISCIFPTWDEFPTVRSVFGHIHSLWCSLDFDMFHVFAPGLYDYKIGFLDPPLSC